jgi:hypothetical protein
MNNISQNSMDIRVGGFRITVVQSLRDPKTEDLVLLNMYGPPQSIRAVWASLKSRKSYHWEFGGTVKLNKSPGHKVFKTEMPNGWANWTFVSIQAIPKQLDPSMPTYCWTQRFSSRELEKPPSSAYPILMASLPYPMLEEWTDYLWHKGRERRVILELRKPTGITGFKILPDKKKWKDIIKEGFTSQKIYIDKPLPSKPVEPEPIHDDEDTPYINVYSRKNALADELQYDANIEPFLDVTQQHYKWPVYMSREVYWLMKDSVETDGNYTDYKGIWHDILNMSLRLNKKVNETTRTFEAYVRMENGFEELQHFTIVTGPFDYDNDTPCIYVKLSSEID